MIGIGIDTGGTYTDAVVYDLSQRKVLAKGKALTTKQNLETGIGNAMDALPAELLKQADILALSTTLATNACVENKGGRAKLILLGSSSKVLKWIDAEKQYGLREEDVLCIDSRSVFENQTSETPEWYQMLSAEGDWLSDAQALAIAEVPAMRNGAVCEKYAKAHLRDLYPVPIIMSNELALDLNVMERGATALLNARLLPVIREFMEAVQRTLKKRGLNTAELIVRSDGSLMAQKTALNYPVQTILSGPASSVIGARNLSSCENCLIVDMGGTTTDISIVKNRIPEMSSRISIGGYRTQIKGVYINTFGLGGDSRITVSAGAPALDTRRVQPLCVAAQEYPEIIPQLQGLIDSGRTHTIPLHEFLYLVRMPDRPEAYTAREQALISLVKKHPVMLGSNDLDIYNLNTERLEQEGILMRCGLTPTDIMHICGDFSRYDKTASVLGATYMIQNLREKMDLPAFCRKIYDLVCRKLYVNIVKMLMENTYTEIFSDGISPQMMELISQCWDERNTQNFFGLSFSTKASLIGIGAPTHIFLPKVASVLGVPCMIPPDAEVANAIGAITADILARCRVRITPNLSLDGTEGYTVYAGDGQKRFETLDQATAFASESARKAAIGDARSRGAMGKLSVDVDLNANTAYSQNGASIELDSFVQATARGHFYI